MVLPVQPLLTTPGTTGIQVLSPEGIHFHHPEHGLIPPQADVPLALGELYAVINKP